LTKRFLKLKLCRKNGMFQLVDKRTDRPQIVSVFPQVYARKKLLTLQKQEAASFS
jgi:hypothetical protein